MSPKSRTFTPDDGVHAARRLNLHPTAPRILASRILVGSGTLLTSEMVREPVTFGFSTKPAQLKPLGPGVNPYVPVAVGNAEVSSRMIAPAFGSTVQPQGTKTASAVPISKQTLPKKASTTSCVIVHECPDPSITVNGVNVASSSPPCGIGEAHALLERFSWFLPRPHRILSQIFAPRWAEVKKGIDREESQS